MTMSFFEKMKKKFEKPEQKRDTDGVNGKSFGQRVKKTFSICYRFRALILTGITLILAIIMAVYCGSHLPEEVGINLQSDGTFSTYVSRGQTILCSLLLTGISLVLMLLSKKTLFPWLVSLFTFAVPILILVTNYLAGVI